MKAPLNRMKTAGITAILALCTSCLTRKPEAPADHQGYVVWRGGTLRELSDETGLTYEELLRINPHLAGERCPSDPGGTR